MPSPASDWPAIRDEVEGRKAHHVAQLKEGLRRSYGNLPAFQSWVREWMSELGLDTQEFRVDLGELHSQPACLRTLAHDSTSLNRGPNVVGMLTEKTGRDGLFIYAHADKFPQTYAWAREQPEPEERGDRIVGPGVADDVAGVVAMLSAVETYLRLGLEPRRSLLCGSLLGKQLSVLGTFGLMQRFGPMSDSIYVHPPESGDGLDEIHHTSNGAIEFHIEVKGRPPETRDPFHVLYDRGTINAIDAAVHIINALQAWAGEAAKRYRFAALEEETGRSFGLSIARVTTNGSNDVLQVPLQCAVEGIVCFPPTVRLAQVRDEMETTVTSSVAVHPRLEPGLVTLQWGDNIGESCATREDSSLVQAATQVLECATGRPPRFTYAYSLSDIRYPLLYWDAQAIGIGPRAGGLATKDEWVDREQYIDTIAVLTAMMREML